ncbi:hypothetical protein JTE90_003659 [Oedothorax gibbosus]|uniref:Uncharacterized protein n=1 Tax=Oedothorax gibbosus TaxID=931172 RepID=A0AAV6VTY3_9ARAC|nr:hypothetical protein JTE90_003659 [Oedothorax gibbosus]
MVNVFHCYELLLLNKLDCEPEFWRIIRGFILKENDYSLKAVPNDLWFVAVTFGDKDKSFAAFLKKILAKNRSYCPTRTDTLLSRYLQYYDFVEMHLDSVFKYGDISTLPKELFRCPNLKALSLKYNFLELLPPDIGRLQNLEYLALSNNKLQNPSLPFSLSFCRSLRVLLLDNNLLDALPGFLLLLPHLNRVHRHGNHNYFKATFMWYHTDVDERILRVPGEALRSQTQASDGEFPSLRLLAAKKIVASKLNFLVDSVVPPSLMDYICDIYPDYNVCFNCCNAQLKTMPGYKVYTFKNPYLGNTAVPFQHWACCLACAEAIEVPARREQLLTAQEQDRLYCRSVQEAQRTLLYTRKGALDTCCIL